MFSSFRSVKMASFLKVCFSVILFSTFLLNVESKQPPYPGGNSNTVNMTCEDGYDNKPLFKLYVNDDKLEEKLNKKNIWFANCNFTFADVAFQADFLFTSPVNTTLEEQQISSDLYYSLTRMEAEISHNSAKIMEYISRLGDVDDNDANSARDGFIKLLKNSAKVESFSLSNFPQLEVITANITLAPSAKKVETTVIMNCVPDDPCNLQNYVSIAEYKEMLINNTLFLRCKFTFGHDKFQSDMFLIERSTETKMSENLLLENDKFYSSMKQFKTYLSNDSFDLLTILTQFHLLDDDDSLKKESMTKFLLRDAESLMLLDFPELGLKMINVTQVTPVKENPESETAKKPEPETSSSTKKTETDYFSMVFTFIILILHFNLFELRFFKFLAH